MGDRRPSRALMGTGKTNPIIGVPCKVAIDCTLHWFRKPNDQRPIGAFYGVIGELIRKTGMRTLRLRSH